MTGLTVAVTVANLGLLVASACFDAIGQRLRSADTGVRLGGQHVG